MRPAFLLAGILFSGLASRSRAAPSNAELDAEIARLGESSLERREQAFATILAWGAVEPERVLAALPAEDPDPEVRDACRRLRLCVPHEGLKRVLLAATEGDPPLQKAIRLAFEAPDFGVLVCVCKQGKGRPDIVGPILRHLMDHEDWQLRQHAVHHLRDFPDASDIPRVKALLADPEPGVRSFAVGTLAGLGGPSAVPDLLSCLKDPSSHVRYNALHALGSTLDADAAAPAAVPLLADPDTTVRTKAVETVRRLGTADLAPRVAELLWRRGDEAIHKVAAGVLARLTGNDWGTDAEAARAWWLSRREDDGARSR